MTARHAQKAIALRAKVTVPRAKAKSLASRVSRAPTVKVAANVVAVAVASAQTVHHAVTCHQRKTPPPMHPAMVLKSKATRKTQVSNARIAPRVRMAEKVADVNAGAVEEANAVRAAVTAHHAASSAQTKPKAAVSTWPLPAWQQVP